METIIKEIKVEGYQDSKNPDGIILCHNDNPLDASDRYAELVKDWGTDKDTVKAAWLAGWDYCRELVRWKTGIKV